MAAGKKRKQGNDIYMYDNLVRIRQTQAEQNTDGYEEEKQVSPQTRKNQRRAMKLGFGYVTFLAGAVAAALFVCFHYVGVRADLDKQTRKIESLRTEITSLKEKIHRNTTILPTLSIWRKSGKGLKNLEWSTRIRLRS